MITGQISKQTSSENSLAIAAQKTHQGAKLLAGLSSEAKNQAIAAIAQSLTDHSSEIIAANQADCAAAIEEGISTALQARLKLDEGKLQGAIAGVLDVGRLPDPIGAVQIHRELDTGLVLTRLSCPLGVLGVIFESRPDAVMQIASLAIKSGNGVILKGGREAIRSCTALVKAIHEGLARTQISPDVVQLLTTREETLELLQLEEYVDLIIPRGSNSFVKFIQSNTQIPVLGHADGICHLYVDRAADLAKAVAIAVDSKTQYPAACNAVETLLVHADIAPKFLPLVATALTAKGVHLKGCDRTRAIISATPVTEWAIEYGDLTIAIKIVDRLAAAIEHIQTYSSSHTEVIVTEDALVAQTFLSQVDAAGVFHNCSSRFADGFRYGFGAEVGISTHKLPPRGPVGLEGLVTYKYQLVGDGHIVASYSGADAKPFLHRDL